jgi:hypothetical protein
MTDVPHDSPAMVAFVSLLYMDWSIREQDSDRVEKIQVQYSDLLTMPRKRAQLLHSSIALEMDRVTLMEEQDRRKTVHRF